MSTDAERRARARYDRRSVTRKVVAFYPTDRDLLEHAAAQGPFATYVKALIRADLDRKREDGRA